MMFPVAQLAAQPAIIVERSAEPDAEGYPAARKHIERRDLPIQQDRMMQRQHDDAREEPYLMGEGRQIAERR